MDRTCGYRASPAFQKSTKSDIGFYVGFGGHPFDLPVFSGKRAELDPNL